MELSLETSGSEALDGLRGAHFYEPYVAL